ncbi:MAG: hypothetical protein DBX52_06500 [Clostridiales bacterium]|nr:MAG: hypothetical protein DBX52_06500 [Clostridiales bacterium]
MKINKKQIVFLSLALVVCIAVYLNWRFLNNVDLDGNGSVVVNNNENQNGETNEEGGKTLGQAQLVETVAKDVNAYFTECRLNKQQTRDEALELLKSVAGSEESADNTRDKANNDMINLAKTTDIEGTIESLIKAKGFSDCMVYISDEAVNVIVATTGLTSEQAAQINEIVISESGKEAAAIKIVEIKTE